ncbi:hypothetical protein EGW08_017502 [Elysia chlorotica]|uniref:Uncharacterized protein n=1 Tax=Elysia chlorotica TaxID=188477 RepID=A0A433SZJ8_ELYCH|nr:hypothetical protein EGW08_017502 [Elysia chlorotica]
MPLAPRIKFDAAMDLLLLREALGLHYFEASNAKSLASHLIEAGFPAHLTPRAVRDRLKTLLDTYKATRRINEASSGIEEEFGEKEQMLEELLVMRDEASRKAKETPGTSCRTTDRDMGAAIRQQALVGLGSEPEGENSPSPGDSVSPSPAKKAKRRSSADEKILSWLATREENRAKEKQQELKLQYDQAELAKREMALREEEATIRREEARLQAEERRLMLNALLSLSSRE